jgi:hypothetical protein
MKIMIGFKATEKFKDFLKSLAKKENRTLSNFIFNALQTYVKEHHGVEWDEDKQKPRK